MCWWPMPPLSPGGWACACPRCCSMCWSCSPLCVRAALCAQRAWPGTGAGAIRAPHAGRRRACPARHCADPVGGNGRLAAGCARKPRAAGGHPGARGLALGAAAERARGRSPAWITHRRPGSVARPCRMGRRSACGAAGLAARGHRGSARAAGAAGGQPAARTGAPTATPPPMPSGRARSPAAPRVALVEAGTGTGKTLGYLAPASVWAEKNGPGLWISTYTRNLQRQIVQEIAHLYPDPQERAEKAVVRKGRENYLCLLNFEEAAKRTALAPGQRSVALGLIARWISSPHRWRYFWRGLSRLPCGVDAAVRPSPTGVANASMPPARITASVSSSAPSAAPAMPLSWSPIMRW